ncbi:GntR family transcriptional regulator [Bordetella genomosp. 10]|uniref:GntR family transcriptional regulator n=1 Tax=Bordetella genomosp. 10 TaxID=1416804 RepID=UPI0015C5D4F4|nr:GntR family transcriptional regulator [Bordetella genomosp. 10]
MRAVVLHRRRPIMAKSAPEVYALIRRRIILGEFSPGTQLKEAGLADQLDVSRTPVRAALKTLANDGLVTIEPNRGAFVAAWTEHDDDEVFDLRILVESHAAALAAKRRQPEHLATLHRLNAELAAAIADKPDDFLERIQSINRQFHRVILQASMSPRLMSFAETLLTAHRVFGAFYHYTDGQLKNSLQDHLNITSAIDRGNARLARALLDAHIRETWERLQAKRGKGAS